MGHKLKIAGWVSLGVVAGALTTVSLQTVARGTMAPLPLEELQQLAAVFDPAGAHLAIITGHRDSPLSAWAGEGRGTIFQAAAGKRARSSARHN